MSSSGHGQGERLLRARGIRILCGPLNADDDTVAGHLALAFEQSVILRCHATGVRDRLAARTRLRGGYLMAVTRNEVVVVLEQVENRFLIVTDLTAEGGTTFSPAAVTGAH